MTLASLLRLVAFPTLAAVLGACASGDDRSSTDESSSSLAPGSAAARNTTDCPSSRPDGLPDELRCTGLYADWETRTLASDVRAYAPGFELWSDGAKKRRFLRLPPGTSIDATDMNAWRFPVGTRLFKEFRLPRDGRPEPSLVETRMLAKLAEGSWAFATYVWSADETSAVRVERGIAAVPGTDGYEVPAERMCVRCHGNRPDRVLGFEAVLLGDRGASGLDYTELGARGWLRRTDGTPLPPAKDLAIPGIPVEREALGRLHANCGISCHNERGPAPFSLRVEITDGRTPGSITETSLFREAIGQASFFAPADGLGTYYRIQPLDEERSTIFYRMSRRDPPGAGFEQMPPIATHRVDEASLAAVRAFIRSMKGPPYPPPGSIE